MKKVFYFLILLLCLSVVVATPTGWNVWGRVVVGGVPEDHVLVKFDNLDSGVGFVRETFGGGEFNVDVSEFGGISVGDTIRVIFCYASWQCDPVSVDVVFSGSGRGVDLSQDFNVVEATFGKFIVHGFVTKNSMVVGDGVVEVTNLRTGGVSYPEILRSEFNFNLADLKYGWWVGDWVQVCYEEKCLVKQIPDPAGPGLDFSFDLTDEEVGVPEKPYYHGDYVRRGRHAINVPDPDDVDDSEGDIIPTDPDDGDDVVVTPPGDDDVIVEPPVKPSSKAWLWVLIISIILLIGAGYWYLKKE